MKLFVISFVFCLFSMVSNAQISGEDEVYLKGDFVDAKFEGEGILKFHDFITSHLDKYILTKPGKIVFTFTISEMGQLKNIRIVEFSYLEMATEIIRVIKLAPNWQPARRGGKPISLNVRFPMEFVKK